mmetsp:Transcript_22048/g.52429  ORF Transcript_22048/g.52429 Transcript_22048/m.52429 type:complete len:196 (+) Transcript_22048:16-603(+)
MWLRFSRVFLSDGGHVDNLGLMELLHRRLRTIFVFDASHDPRGEMKALNSCLRELESDPALRFDRVEICLARDSRLEHLKVDPKTGLSKSRVAGLRVHWKDQKVTDIWYTRATLTPLDPPMVFLARQADPVFPHEPTKNQWLPKKKFDMYRKLGNLSAAQLIDFRYEAVCKEFDCSSPTVWGATDLQDDEAWEVD